MKITHIDTNVQMYQYGWFSPNGENVNFGILSKLTFHSLMKEKPLGNKVNKCRKMLLPDCTLWDWIFWNKRPDRTGQAYQTHLMGTECAFQTYFLLFPHFLICDQFLIIWKDNPSLPVSVRPNKGREWNGEWLIPWKNNIDQFVITMITIMIHGDDHHHESNDHD